MLVACFFLDSFINEHFGWFHALDITNSTKINTEVGMVFIKVTNANEDVENSTLSSANVGNIN